MSEHYWISSDGDDSNTGISSESPVQTFERLREIADTNTGVDLYIHCSGSFYDHVTFGENFSLASHIYVIGNSSYPYFESVYVSYENVYLENIQVRNLKFSEKKFHIGNNLKLTNVSVLNGANLIVDGAVELVDTPYLSYFYVDHSTIHFQTNVTVSGDGSSGSIDMTLEEEEKDVEDEALEPGTDDVVYDGVNWDDFESVDEIGIIALSDSSFATVDKEAKFETSGGFSGRKYLCRRMGMITNEESSKLPGATPTRKALDYNVLIEPNMPLTNDVDSLGKEGNRWLEICAKFGEMDEAVITTLMSSNFHCGSIYALGSRVDNLQANYFCILSAFKVLGEEIESEVPLLKVTKKLTINGELSAGNLDVSGDITADSITASTAHFGYISADSASIPGLSDDDTDTSDEREKDFISDFPEEVLKAWEEVGFSQFKFKSSITEKGKSARFHAGVIAQRIISAFSSHNLDPFYYGILCEEKLKDSEETRYTVRYKEIYALEAAYQRNKVESLSRELRDLKSLLREKLNLDV